MEPKNGLLRGGRRFFLLNFLAVGMVDGGGLNGRFQALLWEQVKTAVVVY